MSAFLLIFGIFLALVLFAWGRWRYDLVAVGVLLLLTFAGVIPLDEVFVGFSHPAVITVVSVLVISRGLIQAGLIDVLAKSLKFLGSHVTIQIFGLTFLVALASAFINNIGALTLMMPIAISIARKNKMSPSLYLIPIAFGSHLGGFLTLIGTPANLIIAGFREEAIGLSFQMFDFARVGLSLVVLGTIFLSVVGWRLLPKRRSQSLSEEVATIKDYTTELVIEPDSSLIGKFLHEVENLVEAEPASVLKLTRGELVRSFPSSFERLRAGDVLTVRAVPETIKELSGESGLSLVGQQQLAKRDQTQEASGHDQNNSEGSDGELTATEAVVSHDSYALGKSVADLSLRMSYGVNLLALSRQGQVVSQRLHKTRFRVGDVLLLQGYAPNLKNAINRLGLLPLADRDLRIGQPAHVLGVGLIFGLSILAVVAGFWPPQIAFLSAAVVMVLVNLLSLRQAYESIDWSLIVLIGAMLPVGFAMETTGAASLIADFVMMAAVAWPLWLVIAILMFVTMFLSDIINNVATVAIMSPIAISLAAQLHLPIDPFLMAVAIGASSAFLTPIGHQSNTLVLGPGGYRFGDYWRVGLPLEILIVLLATPLILALWL